MQWKRKYFLALLLGLACFFNLFGQKLETEGVQEKDETQHTLPGDSTVSPGQKPFIIRDIIIVGNKRTRPDIILREIPFQPGDNYLLQDLVKKFETARQQLMNTTLFHEAVVALKSF